MKMNLNIKEISTKKEIKEFIKFPDRLHSGNKYYIPAIKRKELQTLSFDKNPAFEFYRAKCWLAIKNGLIVGKIAGIINEKYKEVFKFPFNILMRMYGSIPVRSERNFI